MQVFEVDEAVMYQDNLSAIILDNNSRLSSGNRKKHIYVRYFLIKNRIAMGDLKVEYCLTGKMLANHFTKTLQGAAFRKFRYYIQGIPEDTPDTYLVWDRPEDMLILIPQECVGRSDINKCIRTSE